jgi:hypothetical protein
LAECQFLFDRIFLWKKREEGKENFRYNLIGATGRRVGKGLSSRKDLMEAPIKVVRARGRQEEGAYLWRWVGRETGALKVVSHCS